MCAFNVGNGCVCTPDVFDISRVFPYSLTEVAYPVCAEHCLYGIELYGTVRNVLAVPGLS